MSSDSFFAATFRDVASVIHSIAPGWLSAAQRIVR
jgi:hypothetical protein